MFKHILLPLDGSQLAETALPVAAFLAGKLKAQVTLLHVIEKNAPKSIHGQRHLVNEDDAFVYLAEAAQRSFAGEVEVFRHVHSQEVERVAESIVQHSEEFTPDLIILCAHGQGGWRDFSVGNIAQQVIAAGSVPVLLLQPKEDEPVQFGGIENILIALDGNIEHESGYQVGVELAKELKAKIHLIEVVPTLSTLSARHAPAGTLLPVTTTALLDIDEDVACEYLQEKLSALQAQGIQASAEVERGDPARQVVQSADAQHADIIVLGTHGKAGLNAFWSGSVAPRIVEQTRIPILLVPVRR